MDTRSAPLSQAQQRQGQLIVRNTEPRDFAGITDLCLRIYPDTLPWNAEQLSSHLQLFPEGQFVAVFGDEQRVVGMSASLIVDWEDYNLLENWEQFTADGMFTNHDPQRGRTLYGAEVIVDPTLQHHGIGNKLYSARRALTESHKLLRIRAGSRLRGYSHHANCKPEDYVVAVVDGQEYDPTLSFQLREGFHVLAVVPHYLSDDPESLGYAAVIEWLNPLLIRDEHIANRPTRFLRKALARQQAGTA
jgi:ribosomal protein S18 acetylase RimI-like enzyme